MKTKTVRFPVPTIPRNTIAFTLIELLVVIAIMAILASLVLPIGAAIKKKRIVSKSQTELQQIASAIEAYKAKLGVYPPDNPNNINLNQLYYELVGTTLNNAVYTTKDGASTIAASAVPTTFGLSVGGFVNCTQGAGSDEGTMAQTYIRELKPNQIADVSGTKVLVGSVGWPSDQPGAPLPIPPGAASGPNPWHYVHATPTNNTRSFDLWIDVIISHKTNRISNWSDKPIVL
jgi:prepilin-type N-terminal cleavage/methylation domain-containing protein